MFRGLAPDFVADGFLLPCACVQPLFVQARGKEEGKGGTVLKRTRPTRSLLLVTTLRFMRSSTRSKVATRVLAGPSCVFSGAIMEGVTSTTKSSTSLEATPLSVYRYARSSALAGQEGPVRQRAPHPALPHLLEWSTLGPGLYSAP